MHTAGSPLHSLLLLLHTILCLAVCREARAEEPATVRAGAAEVWVGVAGVSFFPLGSWAEHPYAGSLAPAGLQLFGPGGGAALDGGVSYQRWLTSLRIDFTTLGTGAWEAFAREQGEEIASRGYRLAVHAQCLYRILDHRRFHLDFGLGLGYAQGLGSESDHERGLDYDYSFFSPTLSTRQSLVLGLRLHRRADLLLLVDHDISPFGGVNYGSADGARRLWGVSVALGVRFLALKSEEERR